jgi:hypothetical protein
MIGKSSAEFVNSVVLNKVDDDGDLSLLRTSGAKVTRILKLFALERRTIYRCYYKNLILVLPSLPLSE